MKNLILLFLLISTSSYAQNSKILQDKVKQFENEKQKNQNWETDLRATIKDAEATIAKEQATIDRVDYLIKNRAAIKTSTIKEIEDVLDGFSTTQRMFGKKAAYYKCVKDYVQWRDFVNFEICYRDHSADFTPSELKQIDKWKEELGDQIGTLQSKKTISERNIITQGYRIQTAQTQLKHAMAQNDLLAEREAMINAQKEDHKIAEKYKNFVNCDENTPEISLEEKVPFPGATFTGPFVGVPRDNQDGLGTCYANAAKNMLVGLSKGKDVASFLDLALVYKGREVANSGLDGGFTCGVLKKMKDTGYCPQTHAPFETGDKNLYAESLMGGPKGTVWDQAIIVRLLQKFLAGKADLQKGSKEQSEKLLSQASYIIDQIKKNPNVKIPLPVVRFPIPSTWKMNEYVTIAKDKNRFFDENKFMSSYRAEYRKFYPQYVRGVIEGKSRDQIFETFLTTMKPFIDNYKLGDQMKYWKNIFIEDTNIDWNDANKNKNLNESLNFLKAISGTRNKTNEEFLQFCEQTNGDSFHFLASLQPLIKHLTELKLDTNVLFDKDGKFKSSSDLMQLVVAPACLNKEARKPATIPMASCTDGYETISEIKQSGVPYNEQRRLLREKIVVNLVQGYAPGNNINRHVNTIVGMRYNKTKKICEIKIRESQNGSSDWHDEARIFNNIQGLAEVRRK